MNGNDVALLRKDLQHIAELVGELKDDFKEFRESRQQDRECIVKRETWKSGVSKQLGDLHNDAKGNARKQAMIWGAITGGSLNAIALVIQALQGVK